MASVYLAHDLIHDRSVALKVPHPHLLDTHVMRRRFIREARLAARLDHPRIVTVHCVKERAGVVFVDLRFVEGIPLDQLIRSEPELLPVDVVRWLIAMIADGLGYAHSKGVLHRDVKPANILIDRRGEPKVADFGLALSAESQRLTAAGTVLGTPSYMSPEQCRGAALTPASDQYSLGIVAYELLTGRVPFSGAVLSVLKSHVSELPPSPNAFDDRVPKPLSDVVMRMMAKRPEDRWPSMAAAAEALLEGIGNSDVHARQALTDLVRAIVSSGEHAGPVTLGPDATTVRAGSGRLATSRLVAVRAWHWARRRSAPLAICAGAALVVAVAAGNSAARDVAPPVYLAGELWTPEREAAFRSDTMLEVSDASVVRVSISPVVVNLTVGDSMPLVALASGSSGEPVLSRFTWDSDDTSAVRVGGDGWIRAVSPGMLFVHATTGTHSGMTLVLVR